MGPVVCLVTDRKRNGSSSEALIELVASSARAGIDLIQVRERDLDGGALFDLVRRSVEAVRGTQARIIVNDRLDVALAAGANGVHLRSHSMPASRVRTIVPRGFLIGRSVHTCAEGVAATEQGGLDYLIFGTVFRTSSKAGREAAVAGTLAQVAAATPLPVLAIGGITVGRVASIARAGALGFAAIGLFADESLDALAGIVIDARAAFGVSSITD